VVTEPKEVRQAWFEENKHKVTNLSVEDAWYALAKGPGFCLYTDELDQKDVHDANEYINADVESQITEYERALKMGEIKAKVHSHSKTGKAETLGKRVWNLTNKGECFERMV